MSFLPKLRIFKCMYLQIHLQSLFSECLNISVVNSAGASSAVAQRSTDMRVACFLLADLAFLTKEVVQIPGVPCIYIQICIYIRTLMYIGIRAVVSRISSTGIYYTYMYLSSRM